MLQVLEMVIGIDPDDEYSTEHILNEISKYIRKKRSVALDRVEFEKWRQENNETFDEFYIRLQRIAKCADLCEECWDQRLTTRVITGISDQETKKKLLACKEFPKLEDAVILCRGDEAASNNAPMLSNKQNHSTAVNKVSKQRNRSSSRSRKKGDDRKSCQQCGRDPHAEGSDCPAKGKTCNKCPRGNHFANMCHSTTPADGKPTGKAASSSSKPISCGRFGCYTSLHLVVPQKSK